AKDCVKPIEDAMWTAKNEMLRRIATEAFWRIKDADEIAAVEKKIREADGKLVERAMDVVGLRRNMNGFELAVDMLGRYKPGSVEQSLAELALEKQTGHFFGPDPAVWKEWIGKNPKFFEKEQAAIDRAKWREDYLKENGDVAKVTPATE